MLERGKLKRYQIAILAAIPCGSTYHIGSTICTFLFGEEIGTDSSAQGALSYQLKKHIYYETIGRDCNGGIRMAVLLPPLDIFFTSLIKSLAVFGQNLMVSRISASS
jgi:hypothetical protein